MVTNILDVQLENNVYSEDYPIYELLLPNRVRGPSLHLAICRSLTRRTTHKRRNYNVFFLNKHKQRFQIHSFTYYYRRSKRANAILISSFTGTDCNKLFNLLSLNNFNCPQICFKHRLNRFIFCCFFTDWYINWLNSGHAKHVMLWYRDC